MIENIRLTHYRFLVAEANPWDRRQIASMLRAFGATDIHFARDVGETMQMLENQTPDMVILSESLPVLSGPKAVKLIRRHKARPINHIPVLYVVNSVSKSQMEAIARLGVHEVICKPFSTKTLIDRIYWTLMVPRPFVRTGSYFGPEPRTRFWESALGIAVAHDEFGFIVDGRIESPKSRNVDVVEL